MYPHYKYTLLWSIQHLPLQFITLLPPIPHFSTAFNTHPYILYLHTCYALQYCCCSNILFSFPSFPGFHRVVSVQRCSICDFVNSYDCFCVYAYLLDLSSTFERKHTTAFIWLTSQAHLTCIHLPSNHMLLLFLWLSKTPLCIYTKFP
jgi:hypothetical protein